MKEGDYHGGGKEETSVHRGCIQLETRRHLTRKSAMKVTGDEKRGTVANFTPTSALKVTLLGVANMGSCESEPTQSSARCRGLRTARMDRTRYPVGTYTSAHTHMHPHTHMHTQQYNPASHIELDNGTNRLTPTPSEWHLTKFKVTLGQRQLRADIRILLEWGALLWPR